MNDIPRTKFINNALNEFRGGLARRFYYNNIVLGIIYAQPPSDLWYQKRLQELRRSFGNDYKFEMDITDDIYIVYIPRHESTTPYDSWISCETACVFPVTETIPDNEVKGLKSLLEADDKHLYW